MVVDLKKLVEENKRLKRKIKPKKIISKSVIKSSKTSYKVPDRPVTNIFHDENRFFRGAVKNELL